MADNSLAGISANDRRLERPADKPQIIYYVKPEDSESDGEETSDLERTASQAETGLATARADKRNTDNIVAVDIENNGMAVKTEIKDESSETDCELIADDIDSAHSSGETESLKVGRSIELADELAEHKPRKRFKGLKKQPKSENSGRWSEHETERFYSALGLVGTDFGLISGLFFRGSRSRIAVRDKFKKEQKMSPHLIDDALRRPNFEKYSDELKDLLGDSSGDESDD